MLDPVAVDEKEYSKLSRWDRMRLAMARRHLQLVWAGAWGAAKAAGKSDEEAGDLAWEARQAAREKIISTNPKVST
jgi:hypothetical protein